MNEQRYDRQVAFTRQWLESVYATPEDLEARIEASKEIILALHREVDELLDEIPWKTHRHYDSDDVIKSNIQEEVVDIQKYIWAFSAVWGITYSDLSEEFDVKSDVVDDRWRQDHPPVIKELKPIVLIDLDGVLNHYPQPFLDFVEQQTQRKFLSIEQLEAEASEIKVQMKHLYRQSGVKRILPAREDSVFSCQALVKSGYDLVIMSQRPRDRYSRIEGDTLYWLRRHGIRYERLMFVADKQSRLLLLKPIRDRIVFAVDDDVDVVDKLRDLGIKTYWLGGDIPSMIEIPEVREAIGRLGKANQLTV